MGLLSEDDIEFLMAMLIETILQLDNNRVLEFEALEDVDQKDLDRLSRLALPLFKKHVDSDFTAEDFEFEQD